MSIRDELLADMKRRNPQGARDIEDSLRRAMDAPEVTTPKLSSEDEVFAICEEVLTEFLTDDKAVAGMDKAALDKAGYPTFVVEWMWPRGQLSNAVFEEGWRTSFRMAVQDAIANYSHKRPGNWRVQSFERDRSTETRTQLINGDPGKTGIVTVAQEVHRPYVKHGYAVRFVDVDKNPAPRFNAHGALEADSVSPTLQMPQEFVDAMRTMAEALGRPVPPASAPAPTFGEALAADAPRKVGRPSNAEIAAREAAKKAESGE